MKLKIGIGLVIMALLVGCRVKEQGESIDLTVWVTDWDLSRGLEELTTVDVSSVQYFGVYFNEYDEFVMNSTLGEALLNEGSPAYLTFINDIIYSNGINVHKDSELARRLINDLSLPGKIVQLALEYQVEGVELDFEKIPGEEWEAYVTFIDKLGAMLASQDIALRVVLEPSSPIDEIKLPHQYEYVMMMYNLYGLHSEPGPKANFSFIKSLVQKCQSFLENVRFAFSVGGFDWGEKHVAGKTYVQVQELIKTYEVSDVTRDAKSGALSFTYVDETGGFHEVWFADEETIESWINVVMEQGENKVALWRLGGNISEIME